MITTREFFEHDAEDIINNIESIYSVQRKKQINIFLSHFQVKMSFQINTKLVLILHTRIYLVSTIYLTRNNLQ